MADISALGNLNPAEPLDLDIYKSAQEGPSLPRKGRYVVKAPESFPPTAFGATRAGFLKVSVDPQIVGPTNEGYTLRFTSVSSKPFKRSGMSVSQLGDYLKATGLTSTIAGDPQSQANAVERTANATYQVDIDWRAYNKNTGFQVEGMEHFPSDGNGGHQPWTVDPNDFETDESGVVVKDAKTGKPVNKRLRANAVVVRYVATS